MATPFPLFVSMTLTTLNMSYKWSNNTVFGICDCLVSHNVLEVRLCCSTWHNFLLFKDCMVFLCIKYVYIMFSFPTHLPEDNWIASTLRLLWTVLQWAQLCKYLFKILLWILPTMYPEVRLIDHTVILVLVFRGNFILFPAMAAPFYTPTKSAQ